MDGQTLHDSKDHTYASHRAIKIGLAQIFGDKICDNYDRGQKCLTAVFYAL